MLAVVRGNEFVYTTTPVNIGAEISLNIAGIIRDAIVLDIDKVVEGFYELKIQVKHMN